LGPSIFFPDPLSEVSRLCNKPYSSSLFGPQVHIYSDIINSNSTMVLPHSSSPSGQGSICMHFPLLLCSQERVCQDRISLLLVAPNWPSRIWFADLFHLLNSPSFEILIRRDLLSQVGGTILHPRPEIWKLWVWLLRGPKRKEWSLN